MKLPSRQTLRKHRWSILLATLGLPILIIVCIGILTPPLEPRMQITEVKRVGYRYAITFLISNPSPKDLDVYTPPSFCTTYKNRPNDSHWPHFSTDLSGPPPLVTHELMSGAETELTVYLHSIFAQETLEPTLGYDNPGTAWDRLLSRSASKLPRWIIRRDWGRELHDWMSYRPKDNTIELEPIILANATTTYEPSPLVTEAQAFLKNPVPPGAASLAQGAAYQCICDFAQGVEFDPRDKQRRYRIIEEVIPGIRVESDDLSIEATAYRRELHTLASDIIEEVYPPLPLPL